MIRLFILALTVTGCAYFRSGTEVVYSEQNIKRDQAEIASAVLLLKQKEYEKANEAFLKFQSERQTSPFWLSAQLGLADSYHQLGRSNEALEVLRKVRDTSLSRSPGIAAMASYQMSFVFEDLGQFEKTLASLSEAENQGLYLKSQIAKVEIPARKSIVYAKIGQPQESQALMAKALRGIETVRAQEKNLPINWEAEALVSMGKVSTQSQAGDSWDHRLEVLNLVYPVLYRAILLQAEPYSSQARQIIYDQYQGLFNTLNSPANDLRKNRQMAVGLDIFLQRAVLFRTDKVPSGAQELFKLEDDLRKNISNLVFSIESDMPQTPESLQRAIKVEGYRLVDPDISSASELQSGIDPNL